MKGLLTQFCSRSIAIQRLVPCEGNGDQWGGPKFSPQVWALGTLRRKKGLSLSTGTGTRRNDRNKKAAREREGRLVEGLPGLKGDGGVTLIWHGDRGRQTHTCFLRFQSPLDGWSRSWEESQGTGVSPGPSTLGILQPAVRAGAGGAAIRRVTWGLRARVQAFLELAQGDEPQSQLEKGHGGLLSSSARPSPHQGPGTSHTAPPTAH